MNNNIKNESKFIEQWSLSKIIDNYNIENSLPIDDLEELDHVVNGFSATFPMSILRTLPNYARLKIIELLEYSELLSMDNIHYVEAELRNVEEAYENYDWFTVVVACNIKQGQRGSYV